MTTANRFLAILAVAALGLVAAWPAESFADSRLNAALAEKVTKMADKLDALAADSDRWSKTLSDSKTKIETMRGFIANDAQLASTPAGGQLLKVVEDMGLGCDLLQSEVRYEQNSLKILSEVARMAVAGQPYLPLDNALLRLEQAQKDRERVLGQLRQLFDLIDGQLVVVGASTNRQALLDLTEMGRLGAHVLRSTHSSVVTDYESVVKPVTESLRGVVDDLSKR